MALDIFFGLAAFLGLAACVLLAVFVLLLIVVLLIPPPVSSVRSRSPRLAPCPPSPPPSPRALRSPLLDVSSSDGPAHAPQVGAAVPRDGSGRYVVPGTVNGVDVEFLIDTGASAVAIPAALAQRLDLRTGEPVQITTTSAVVPRYLVTLEEVCIGLLACTCVSGSVSERHVGDRVLLGMSFLGHYMLCRRGSRLPLSPGDGP